MKTNPDCSIVSDLLPLSMDHLTSAESEALVQAHLQTCEQCRRYKEKLYKEQSQQRDREQQHDRHMFRFLKRRRYEMLGLFLGLILIPLLILGLLVLPYVTADTDGEGSYSVKEHFESPADYGKQNYRGIAGLQLFPAPEQMNGQITEFFYDCKGQKLYQTYQIFLSCHYAPTDYEAEKQRLLQTTDPATGRTPVYSEEENALPCIYAMLYDEGYEYALLSDADCTIHYIYLQGADRRELQFPTSYLPKNYGQFGYSFETERDPYRIYPYDWEI